VFMVSPNSTLTHHVWLLFAHAVCLGSGSPGQGGGLPVQLAGRAECKHAGAALSREACSPQYATLCHTVLCCVVMFAGDRSAGRLQEAAGRVSAPSLYVCVA
jgi:hypothetical protein